MTLVTVATGALSTWPAESNKQLTVMSFGRDTNDDDVPEE
jgi:hypothetical protein